VGCNGSPCNPYRSSHRTRSIRPRWSYPGPTGENWVVGPGPFTPVGPIQGLRGRIRFHLRWSYPGPTGENPVVGPGPFTPAGPIQGLRGLIRVLRMPIRASGSRAPWHLAVDFCFIPCALEFKFSTFFTGDGYCRQNATYGVELPTDLVIRDYATLTIGVETALTGTSPWHSTSTPSSYGKIYTRRLCSIRRPATLQSPDQRRSH
jgi:hypothetical protein